MPSDLIEPPGMAPASGDDTLSPLRRWRDEIGERVADRPATPSGPVAIGATARRRRPRARGLDMPVLDAPVDEREDG
jgi:hypothetical protein